MKISYHLIVYTRENRSLLIYSLLIIVCKIFCFVPRLLCNFSIFTHRKQFSALIKTKQTNWEWPGSETARQDLILCHIYLMSHSSCLSIVVSHMVPGGDKQHGRSKGHLTHKGRPNLASCPQKQGLVWWLPVPYPPSSPCVHIGPVRGNKHEIWIVHQWKWIRGELSHGSFKRQHSIVVYLHIKGLVGAWDKKNINYNNYYTVL